MPISRRCWRAWPRAWIRRRRPTSINRVNSFQPSQRLGAGQRELPWRGEPIMLRTRLTTGAWSRRRGCRLRIVPKWQCDLTAFEHLERRRRACAQHRDIAHYREEAHAALFERCRALGRVAERAGHFAGLLTSGDDAVELSLH